MSQDDADKGGKAAAGNGARNGKDREARAAEIQALNIERARNPLSVLVLPQTTEGFLLCRMLLTLEKAVFRLRRETGSSIPVAEAMVWLKKVEGIAGGMKDILKRFGIAETGLLPGMQDGWEAPEVREKLAARRNAYVLLPRVEVVRELVTAIQPLDGALQRLRLTSADLTKAAESMKRVVDLIKELHEVTEGLAEKLKIPYTPPRRFEQLVGVAQPAP